MVGSAYFIHLKPIWQEGIIQCKAKKLWEQIQQAKNKLLLFVVVVVVVVEMAVAVTAVVTVEVIVAAVVVTAVLVVAIKDQLLFFLLQSLIKDVKDENGNYVRHEVTLNVSLKVRKSAF